MVIAVIVIMWYVVAQWWNGNLSSMPIVVASLLVVILCLMLYRGHTVYNVWMTNPEGVAIGDGAQANVPPENHQNELSGELDVRIREQARIDCGYILAPVDLERPIVPVNLEIASEPVRVSSELDEEGHFHRRKDFVKLFEQPPGKFNETEMFQYPKQKAQKEAEKFQTNKEKEDHVARNGNIIGVVGQPGIGKTTSIKKWVGQILNRKLLPDVTFLFLIFVRNIDFSQQMTLFDLLVSTVLTDWKHSPENDRAWLEKILKDRNVLIALDGFDEANVENLRKRSPKVNIYDKAFPLDLLLNLFSGNLLPFARIIITSRPKQLFHIHPDHRPKFVVQILGLNRQGQDELGRQICFGSYEQIREIILNNADVFAYCYIPVNFILTVFFLMNRKRQNDFVCMTLVLSFACEKYSCSDQLKGKECNLDKLSKLAWIGFKKKQITFQQRDFEDANLDQHTIHSFMNTSVVESTDIKMTIMEGHERSYFSHLIWQEYFAALYLILFVSDEEFEESLKHLFDDRWQLVIRFLFGLCNHASYGRVKCVIPTHCTSTRDQWKKKKAKLLKVATTYFEGQRDERLEAYDRDAYDRDYYDSNKEKWQKLLHMCSCVHEANDHDMTGAVAARFPASIIMSGTILPSDISNFFHVVRAALTLPILAVYRCNFAEDSLTRFWKEVAASCIKIQNIHLKHQWINDDDLSNIVESLQHVEELRLRNCYISRSLIAALAQRWEQTKPQIRLLDLTNDVLFDNLHNQIGDEGLSCLMECLQFVRWLDLYNCDISSTGVKILTDKLLETGHKLEYLNLSFNRNIDHVGWRSLIHCLHLIEKLDLYGCDVTDAVKEEIKLKLKRLRLPETRVKFTLL